MDNFTVRVTYPTRQKQDLNLGLSSAHHTPCAVRGHIAQVKSDVM